MIKLSNLSAGYGESEVLKEITFTIPSKEITCVIGPNGCGKSTLLKCLGHQLPTQSGSISFMGKSLPHYSPKDFAKQVTYLSQSRSIPEITVENLVLFGRFPYMSYPRRFSPQDKQLAQEAMNQTGVWKWKDRMLGELSGGEQQKVYLAMALAQNTEILLLDEPTTYLDMKHQLELLQLFRHLREMGKTLVIVLHDLSQAMEIADNICLLDSGMLRYWGTPQQLLEKKLLDQVFSLQISVLEVDGKKQLLYRL